eukprot:165744_1
MINEIDAKNFKVSSNALNRLFIINSTFLLNEFQFHHDPSKLNSLSASLIQTQWIQYSQSLVHHLNPMNPEPNRLSHYLYYDLPIIVYNPSHHQMYHENTRKM